MKGRSSIGVSTGLHLLRTQPWTVNVKFSWLEYIYVFTFLICLKMFKKSNDPGKPDIEMNLDCAHPHTPASGSTLLPRPIASLISLITQSSSLSLRLGTFFGGAALDGARATTLTSLELSRALVEGILTRAGRDVAIRSGDELGRTEAESLLERSVCS